MGTPLSYAAGAAADSLEEQLKQMFLQQLASRKASQDDTRIGIEQQRVNDETAYRQMAEKDRLNHEATTQHDTLVNQGLRAAPTIPIGTDVLHNPLLPSLQAAGVPMDAKDPTLNSVNMTGYAQGGTAPAGNMNPAPTAPPQSPALRITGIANPGAPAKLIDLGTEKQQSDEARQQALTRFARAHPDLQDAIAALDPDKAQGLVTEFAKLQAPQKKTFESKPAMVNGRETLANFDPATGKYFDAATGADISAQTRPMPPAAMRVQVNTGGGSGTTPDVDASRPDPTTGNRVDGRTGMTPNALYQNAVSFALEGRIPPGGRSSQGQAQNARMAIQNKAGAIAAAAGVDLPTVQAEYAANKTALGKLLPQAQATANFANTAKDNMQLAMQESPQVTRTDAAWVNQVTNDVMRGAMPAANLTKFETYIYTAAREYAKVTGGAAMSASGLSDTAAREASKLLNASQSPAAFAAAVGAMQDDMDNVTKRQAEGVRTVSDTIGRFFSAANGVPVSTAKTGSGGASETADHRVWRLTGKLGPEPK